MNKYQSGKIYKIISNETDACYIGSTTEPTLSKRMVNHRADFNRWKNGNRGYVSSFELLEKHDCKIILLENYPCNTKDELRAREQHWIDNTYNCVNKYNAHGQNTLQYAEKRKQYNENNKDHLIEMHKKYLEDNKEYFKEKRKDYIEKNKEHIQNYMKKYNESNKLELHTKSKEYRQKNKESIRQKRKETCVCHICGSVTTKDHMSRHSRTQYHTKFIELNNRVDKTDQNYYALFN